jgi:hypothetical protein
MSKTYEIIWSYAEDRYVIRQAFPWQLLKPQFTGTFEACKTYLENLSPR